MMENKPGPSKEYVEPPTTEETNTLKDNPNDIYITSESSSDDCLILNENSTLSKKNGKQLKEKRKLDQSLNLSKKMKVFEMLPDCIRKKELIVPRPKSIYIPKNINITKRSYKINLLNLSPNTIGSNNSLLNQRQGNESNFGNNSYFWNMIRRNCLLKQSVANLPVNQEIRFPYTNYLSDWSFRIQNNDLHRQINSCSTTTNTTIKESIQQDIMNLYSLYLSTDQNDASNRHLAQIVSLFKKFNRIFQEEDETERLSVSSDNEVRLIPMANKSVKRHKRSKSTLYESSSDEAEVSPAKKNLNNVKREFHSWIPDSSWAHPVHPQKYSVGRFSTMASFNEYMESIKEISLEPGVESWNQANNIYDDRKVIATVCISDEEMEDKSNNSTNNLTPLLESEDCVTVEKVLNKLQVIETATFEDVKENDDGDFDIKIFFNLYPPNMKSLKKSPLQNPSYFIAILR